MNNQKSHNNKPTHSVRTLIGHGKNAQFETIGVAWIREGKDIYVKLHGTQIVDKGFYIFPNKTTTANETS